jgi:DNA polymerase I-like protein with 3'-5' exonuclease and polymerase domains
VGVVHRNQKKKLHANYDIAGQVNGRMRCDLGFTFGYNPHSAGEEERKNLRPSSFDHLFIYLDFRHMEVNALQWLSEDKALGEILESGEDVYEGIWRELTGLSGDPSYRDKCKTVFLPVAYGLGAKALAYKLKISEATASRLWANIYKKFPQAMGWLRNQEIIGGEVCDAFGRCRKFEEDLYKIRNFVVQSPASLLCLDKLVVLRHDLGNIAKVVAHVHDGYILSAHATIAQQAKEMAVKSLETESEFFPGLKLKVSCRMGQDLNNLTK